MEAKQSVSHLILGILILVLGIGITVAAEPFENLPADTIIAEVLGQKVSFGDIEPNSALKKKQQESNNDGFNLWLKQTRASNLGRYFKPLWDEYTKEKGLEVTEQEINESKGKMTQLKILMNNEQKAKRDSLAKELLATNLKDDKKAELEKSFKLYNNLVEKSPDPKLIYHSTDSNSAKLVDNTYKTFILRWKINNELYKQYKGRVIFQQAGPEPLDAYRLFLEEQQSKGKFKFYNKDAEDLFWNYWRSTGHTFIKDPNEAEQMMNTPWWQKEKKENYYDKDAEWGEELNGFQIRLKASTNRGDRIFFSDKICAFKMDLLNTGEKTFNCAPLEQFCEVEIDGKWYKWNGTAAVDILAIELKPKNVHYDFFEIKLTENWILKESKEDKSQTVSLSLGEHIIRVKYKTMSLPEYPETETISNSLKFKMLPPRPKK